MAVTTWASEMKTASAIRIKVVNEMVPKSGSDYMTDSSYRHSA